MDLKLWCLDKQKRKIHWWSQDIFFLWWSIIYFVCVYFVNIFFWKLYDLYWKEKSGIKLLCIHFIFSFLFIETKKTSASVFLRENPDFIKEIVIKVLDDMVSLISKNATEPQLSTFEENCKITGSRGQNRRGQHKLKRWGYRNHYYKTGIKQDIIAAKYRINQSLDFK